MNQALCRGFLAHTLAQKVNVTVAIAIAHSILYPHDTLGKKKAHSLAAGSRALEAPQIYHNLNQKLA